MTELEQRKWGMIAHVTALLGVVVGGAGWIGPLVIYLLKKDVPFVRQHAAAALNFNLTVLGIELLAVVAAIGLMFAESEVILLILVMLAIFVAWLALTIRAAIRANDGKPVRYPLAIPFVR
ncbi:MAG TPA: DUF4870 domain-containing protein [Kofleriaceae bacterium]|nr:DUF4870 domain-containing protein [Kofleriaceae bacterium]